MHRIDQLKTFLADSPQDAFLQHALALEYIKADDDATARRYFESLLQQNPAYVGSYYHLGKLLERAGETAPALSVYEKGMQVSKAAGDGHAYNELQAAYDDLADC